jgi:abortive infection bacteriophage resistance protein
MSVYKAPPLSLEEQIARLKRKGLLIDNADYAIFWLSHVSYYRLKNYTFQFRDKDPELFISNTSFGQVLSLYQFDRKLKLILFDSLECIEVALKTLVSNLMSCEYGAHWYLDRNNFSSQFNYEQFITSIENECGDPDEIAIKVYKNLYAEPVLPPSWMAIELLSFGAISKIFEHLTAREDKQKICRHLGLPDNILISWFHCFTHLRNRCAHHCRIVYRSVKHEPILPSRQKHRFLNDVDSINRSSLYCVLCCVQFLMNKINPQSDFKKGLLMLINENPEIVYTHMGFTENWREEAIWQ